MTLNSDYNNLYNKNLKDEKNTNEKLKNELQDMISKVSHDLKTPLTSIISFLQLYLLEEKNYSKREEVSIALKNAKFMQDIINKNLDFSRYLNSNNLKFTNEDILEIINDAINETENLFKKKNITIKKTFTELPKLLIDKTAMQEVFQNILKNAADYSNKNKNVEIICESNNNKINISIKDEGIGIDKKYLNKIFDNYYRIDSSRSSHNSGLGLAISKKIVTNHGGKIYVKSDGANKGSCFVIELKVKK